MRVLRVGGWLLLGLVVAVILAPAGFWVGSRVRETETADRLAPRSGRFVVTRSGRVFVQEAGPADGPAVLLVHGMAGWSELWRATLDELGGRGYRAIAIDLPPFGFSDRDPASDYSRPVQAERLRDLVDALGLSRIVVVAHSIGAAPVVEAAMRYGDRFRGLVLVCGALGLADEGEAPGATWVEGVLGLPVLRDPLVASTVTNPMLTQALFRRLVAREDAVDDRVTAVLQRPMALRDSTPEMGRWLRGVVAPAPGALSVRRGNYGAVSIPTRLIWGELDGITPLAQGEEARRLFPDATLTVLAGVGHVPQIEDSGAFHRVLVDALRVLDGGGVAK